MIGLQEYGVTNASLIAGLEARGATVEPLRVYGWELPTETDPLEENIRALAAGERDLLLLTSAHQVVNLLRMAEKLDIVQELRAGLRQTVIASIGPTTTQMLEECELHVDMEPIHPKMGHLVVEAAQRARSLLATKPRPQRSSGSPMKCDVADAGPRRPNTAGEP